MVLAEGDLPRARDLLCNYLFTLRDVEDLLPLCRNGAHLLDAVNDRLRRGLRYLDNLDIEPDEGAVPTTGANGRIPLERLRLAAFKEHLDMNTVTELPAVMRGRHMLRETNEGLMIQWINEDRLNRSHLDVRESVVLYDENGLFEYAMPDVPDPEMLEKLFNQTTIRYWSRGIA